MSKPGPKPKPSAIRKFEGNPGNLPINELEPKPETVDSMEYADWMEPDCEFMNLEKFPLHEVAKIVWDEYSTQLIALGVLTKVDKGKFARYCETFARWLKMKAFLDRHGETYPVYGGQFEPVKDAQGNLVYKEDGSVKHEFKKYLKQMRAFPQVQMYTKLMESLRKYEEEFGIGAASRTRIQVVVESALTGGEKKDDDHDFDYARRGGLRAVK